MIRLFSELISGSSSSRWLSVMRAFITDRHRQKLSLTLVKVFNSLTFIRGCDSLRNCIRPFADDRSTFTHLHSEMFTRNDGSGAIDIYMSSSRSGYSLTGVVDRRQYCWEISKTRPLFAAERSLIAVAMEPTAFVASTGPILATPSCSRARYCRSPYDRRST